VDPTAQARQILAANSYLTLATADADGRPWSTPVWFAADDLHAFCWVSRPGARHSVNVVVRPTVAITIFDSTVPSSEATALYVEAEATEVEANHRRAVLAVYNERSTARGLPEWTEEKVTPPAQFRLYRAIASQVYVLDDHDQRVPVDKV